MFFAEDLPTPDQDAGVESQECVGSGDGGVEEEEDVGVRYERVKQKTHKAQIEPVSRNYSTLFTHMYIYGIYIIFHNMLVYTGLHRDRPGEDRIIRVSITFSYPYSYIIYTIPYSNMRHYSPHICSRRRGQPSKSTRSIIETVGRTTSTLLKKSEARDPLKEIITGTHTTNKASASATPKSSQTSTYVGHGFESTAK